jgi:hypothetical protein
MAILKYIPRYGLILLLLLLLSSLLLFPMNTMQIVKYKYYYFFVSHDYNLTAIKVYCTKNNNEIHVRFLIY